MKTPKITEADIVAVLIGDADPELEARVMQAVHLDLKTQALYTQWANQITFLRNEADAYRAGQSRVIARVMEQIEENKARAGTSFPSERDAAYPEALDDPMLDQIWTNSASSHRRRILLTIAGTLLALLVLGLLLGDFFALSSRKVVVQKVRGEVIASQSTDVESPTTIKPGDNLTIPLRFISAAESEALLSLPQGLKLSIRSDSEVLLTSIDHIRQTKGTAEYQIPEGLKWRKGHHTVELMVGEVQAESGTFEITYQQDEGTLINVASGLVTLLPENGKPLQIKGNGSAFMSRTEAKTVSYSK